MDDGDIGKESEEFHLKLALQSRQRKGPVAENIFCIDCGEEIPEARRLAERGCERCIACQTAAEEKGWQ